MLNNPTFKKYESSVTDYQQFGVENITVWYKNATQYNTPQELVMSLLSDIQYRMDDPDRANNTICNLLVNRVKWVTHNKLQNK